MEGSTSCARSGRRAVKNSSARIFPEIYRRPFAPGDAVVHFGETRRKSRLGGRSSCAGGSHRRRTRTKTAIIAPIRQFPFCPISESRFRGRLVFDSVDDEAVVDFFAPAGATLGARPCTFVFFVVVSHVTRCGGGCVSPRENGTTHGPRGGFVRRAPRTALCVTPQLEYFNYLGEKCRDGCARTVKYGPVRRPNCGNPFAHDGRGGAEGLPFSTASGVFPPTVEDFSPEGDEK
ncbi:hypothetical protein MTP99_000209 [Tenebrio molitor]|jgi:hypothetical protein|nr:hypothetical protein MTP99_000209 [Tenebrio molitor]